MVSQGQSCVQEKSGYASTNSLLKYGRNIREGISHPSAHKLPPVPQQGLTKPSPVLSRLSIGIIWEISSPLLSSQSVSCMYILYQLSYQSYYSIVLDNQQLFIVIYLYHCLYLYLYGYVLVSLPLLILVYLYYLYSISLPLLPLSYLYSNISTLSNLIYPYPIEISSPLLIYAYLFLIHIYLSLYLFLIHIFIHILFILYIVLFISIHI